MKILAATFVAAVIAASATAAPQKNYFTFRAPGGIQCGIFLPGRYSEALLRCDIRTGLKPHVRRPKGCKFDYGSTLELRANGRAFPGCVSDAIAPPGPMLAFGKTHRKGPFTCRSARAGLTCRNSAAHGFFLSKKAWRRV